jgi:hypothetical protein
LKGPADPEEMNEIEKKERLKQVVVVLDIYHYIIPAQSESGIKAC